MSPAILLVAPAMAALVAATAPPAVGHWEGAQIGMSLADARATYPDAVDRRDRTTGAHTLQLAALDAYGAHWRSGALVFNAYGRLESVQLQVEGGDYDALERKLYDQLNQSQPQSGAISVAYGDPGEVEIRVCQMSDASIVVTFEHARLSI